MKRKLFLAAEWSFLAGTALLIVRNNSYPWPLRRATDILLALSFAAAVAAFFLPPRSRLPKASRLAGLAAILAAGGMATAAGASFASGWNAFDKSGLLESLRVAESLVTIFLIALLADFDASLVKKFAAAQLSTLAYLIAFANPQRQAMEMYRFQLFENWPSNVGYYLIPGILLFAILLLNRIRKNEISLPYLSACYLGALFLSAISLWAQSRASWLGMAVAVCAVYWLWAAAKTAGGLSAAKRLAAAGALVSIPLLAFSILPNRIQNLALGRLSPQLNNFLQVGQERGTLNYATLNPVKTLEISVSRNFPVQLSDPHRLKLWGIYGRELLHSPWGIGPAYPLANIGAGPQGPHDTILEILLIMGPLGLAAYFLLWGTALRNLLPGILRLETFPLYLAASLAALGIASLFDNMSTFRLTWLILGLALTLSKSPSAPRSVASGDIPAPSAPAPSPASSRAA